MDWDPPAVGTLIGREGLKSEVKGDFAIKLGMIMHDITQQKAVLVPITYLIRCSY